jgi:hypothetical protein
MFALVIPMYKQPQARTKNPNVKCETAGQLFAFPTIRPTDHTREGQRAGGRSGERRSNGERERERTRISDHDRRNVSDGRLSSLLGIAAVAGLFVELSKGGSSMQYPTNKLTGNVSDREMGRARFGSARRKRRDERGRERGGRALGSFLGIDQACRHLDADGINRGSAAEANKHG